MSGDLSNLDFDSIDENAGLGNFEPLPAGSYTVEIGGAEVRENKSGTGSYLALQFDVIDGEHTGRKLWENLTVTHTNEIAQNIGRAQIKRLCKELGVNGISDSSELRGRQLVLKIAVAKKRDGSGLENKVSGYAGLAPAKPSAPPAQTKPAGSPWAKKPG